MSFFPSWEAENRENNVAMNRPKVSKALLYNILEQAEQERNEVVQLAKCLQEEVELVQAETETVMKEMEKSKARHDAEVQTLLLGMISKSPASPTSIYLGPVHDDIEETPEQVGDFALGCFLGRGRRNTVVQALDKASQKWFAVKMFSKKRLESPGALRQLETELQVLGCVSHPNVNQMAQLMNTPENVYMVMELGYLDLHAYLERNRPHCQDNNAFRECIAGILDGLAYLHENGVYHMNLNATNVLLTKYVEPQELSLRHVQLSGFGVCAMESNGRVEGIRGTVGFYAPEMQTVGTCDGRSADMWSMGATIVQIVDGKLGDDWMDCYNNNDGFETALRECLLAFRGRCSDFVNPQAHDLVEHLLVLYPDHRLHAPKALEHAWFSSS
mmetsp:Transcript_984/g.2406  ORF Transcript_984/g.2406 Transcript_984/m.2406 type:complete len:387 (-) Transcript_984:1848-3008(-)